MFFAIKHQPGMRAAAAGTRGGCVRSWPGAAAAVAGNRAASVRPNIALASSELLLQGYPADGDWPGAEQQALVLPPSPLPPPPLVRPQRRSRRARGGLLKSEPRRVQRQQQQNPPLRRYAVPLEPEPPDTPSHCAPAAAGTQQPAADLPAGLLPHQMPCHVAVSDWMRQTFRQMQEACAASV